MTILIIGEAGALAECAKKFGNDHQLLHFPSHHEARSSFARSSIILDFIIDEDLSQLQFYAGCKAPVFLNSVKSTLQHLTSGMGAPADLQDVRFFGFNGLPTFVDRQVLEVTVVREGDRNELEGICKELGTAYEIVADRPGMVTARVICMIINEAWCTIGDGTALPAAIDVAMKLGTNYPRGPVEWGRMIGLRNVTDVLGALYRETGDARYSICDLLAEEARQE
jgi:3-hydroxybutyryl-CoA dehydrogenase